MTDEQTIRDLVQPLFDAMQKAGPTITHRDAQAIEGATSRVARTARHVLSDEAEALREVQARMGFGLLQSFGAKGFASKRDAAKLMDLAVDLAAADPHVDALMQVR